jgi:hypothetical protein
MVYDTATEKTIFLQYHTENDSGFFIDFTKACGPFLFVKKGTRITG